MIWCWSYRLALFKGNGVRRTLGRPPAFCREVDLFEAHLSAFVLSDLLKPDICDSEEVQDIEIVRNLGATVRVLAPYPAC